MQTSILTAHIETVLWQYEGVQVVPMDTVIHLKLERPDKNVNETDQTDSSIVGDMMYRWTSQAIGRDVDRGGNRGSVKYLS